MKKALLAVAVMATFGSASAYAKFGTATEHTGVSQAPPATIAVSGNIIPPSTTWVVSIDESPMDLQDVETQVTDWRKVNSEWQTTLNTTDIPLIKLRTKSTTIGAWATPEVTINGSPNILGRSPKDVVEEKTIEVKTDDGNGQFQTAPDIKLHANISYAASHWVGYSSGAGIKASLSTALTDGSGWATSELLPPGSAQFGGILDLTFGDLMRHQITGIHAGARITQAETAAVVGFVKESVKLITNRTQRPTGAWQAVIPVEVKFTL